MRCKRCRHYTQLMLLVGAMFVATPTSSHQVGNDAHGVVGNSYSVWHNTMHAIESCIGQFSSGYLVFLMALLAVLAFVIFKIKRLDRVIPS